MRERSEEYQISAINDNDVDWLGKGQASAVFSEGTSYCMKGDWTLSSDPPHLYSCHRAVRYAFYWVSISSFCRAAWFSAFLGAIMWSRRSSLAVEIHVMVPALLERPQRVAISRAQQNGSENHSSWQTARRISFKSAWTFLIVSGNIPFVWWGFISNDGKYKFVNLEFAIMHGGKVWSGRRMWSTILMKSL